MSAEYYYPFVDLKVKRVVKARYGNPEFFVADVQCVDEHGHRLELLRDVVCGLGGFLRCLEEEFSDEEIAALMASGVSDPPDYYIYNDDEFRLSAVRQLALLPSELSLGANPDWAIRATWGRKRNEQKFALMELICDGTIMVGKVTIHDTEEIAIAEGIRRYGSASDDGDDDGDAPVLKMVDRDGHKQWIETISGEPVFQVAPVDSTP